MTLLHKFIAFFVRCNIALDIVHRISVVVSSSKCFSCEKVFGFRRFEGYLLEEMEWQVGKNRTFQDPGAKAADTLVPSTGRTP